MLNELSTTLLLPAELKTTSERIIHIVRESITTEPFVDEVITTIETDKKQLDEALLHDRTNEYTKVLLGKDLTRDNAYVSVRDLAQACTRRLNPDEAKAGELIIDIIRKHGWQLNRLPYAQESAELNLLFVDLDAPAAAAALKTIGGETCYTDLKKAQAEFEKTYNQKVSAQTKEDYPYLAQARNKLSQHLQILLGCIEILMEIRGPEKYKVGVDKLNAVITEIMAIARARKTRNEKTDTIAD
ncbi:DUF6261 family protein [candidate division KSB1 bacterium]|nr:DUF6261 family protein [candidate division KSB1 bacterium]